MTIAHRRAVDRVRSEADEVAEAVESSLEAERVSRCLDGLTDLPG
jgi:hypothetical protein